MIRRPTIAVDARALVDAPAGVGYYTRSLVGRLAKLGGAKILCLSHRSPRDVESLRDAGVGFETLRAPSGFWWQRFALPRRLRKDVDAFWAPVGTLPPGLSIPSTMTVHDLTPVLYPHWHAWRNRVSFKQRIIPSLRDARAVIAVSEATARDLERRFPTSGPKIQVIHNGVDPEFKPVHPDRIPQIRHRLGVPHGYLLFVGTLEPRKNIDRLLTAWHQAQEERPESPPLLIAGGPGWHSRDLRRKLADFPNVKYLGRLPRAELVELMQAAVAFVYPSLYEGFGLPVVEAMACGVPVITSDRSSLPEVAGDAALLVNPQHTRELRKALGRILDDAALRKDLATRGLAQAAQFSWDKAAEQLERALLRTI